MLANKKNPIGIYEKAFPAAYGLHEKLLEAKQIGFDYMEISIDETDERLERLYWDDAKLRNLRVDIEEIKTPILSMCLSAHRRFPMGSRDRSIRAKSMEIMGRAIDFALNTGIRIIQMAGYDVYYETAGKDTQKWFFDNLQESVSLASRCGITLAMETMDTEFINSVTKAMNLIRRIHSPWFQVYPDIGNLSAWEKDVEAELELGIEHCVAIHVKETRINEFKRVPFCEGSVRFRENIQKLIELGYQGPFMIEMWQEDNPAAIDAVQDALNFIRSIVQAGAGQQGLSEIQ